MTAAAVKPSKPKLTLRDTSDLMLELNRYIDDHVDELELNGGALPDDLARLLDEIDASRGERADAIAFKLDEFTGYATTAKATKDRAARRQKVWDNAITALRAYALREVERLGGAPIKGASAVLRIQINGGAPATECRFDNEQLLAFADASVQTEPREGGIARYVAHPLAAFITVVRTAVLDKKALGAAYEARRAELERDIALLSESDIPWLDGQRPENATPEQVEVILADMRAKYIADNLAAEFPGITVTRGHHLRVE